MPFYRDASEDLAERTVEVHAFRDERLPPSKKRWLARIRIYRSFVIECPEEFRPWLRNVIDRHIAEVTSLIIEEYEGISSRRPFEDEDMILEDFLNSIQRQGFVRTVLWATAENYYPDLLEVSIRHRVLELIFEASAPSEIESHLEAAVELLPKAASNPGEAFAWLASCMNRFDKTGFAAALKVFDLAPETPGLAECLIEAASMEWDSWNGDEFASQSPRAMWTLMQLPFTPALEDRAVREILRLNARLNERATLEFWFRFGRHLRDLPEIEELLDSDAALEHWLRMPETDPLRAKKLAIILAKHENAMRVTRRSCTAEFDSVLAGFRQSPLAAEELLPAIVKLVQHSTLEDDIREHQLDRCRECVHSFLKNMRSRPESWYDGDRWIATLSGVPLQDFRWLIYADWLEEFRQDDRAGRLRGQFDGFNDAGAGWGEVYSWVASDSDSLSFPHARTRS